MFLGKYILLSYRQNSSNNLLYKRNRFYRPPSVSLLSPSRYGPGLLTPPALNALPTSQLLHHSQMPSGLTMGHHHHNNVLGLNNNNNNNTISANSNLLHETTNRIPSSNNSSSNHSLPTNSPNHLQNGNGMTPVSNIHDGGENRPTSLSSNGSGSPNMINDNDGKF